MRANGSVSAIAELAQILAWLAAAMRASDSNALQYSKSNMSTVFKSRMGSPASSETAFSITVETIPLPGEQSCWFPLFPRAVIALGFPIPERDNDELGLEAPLDMMASLCGATLAIDYCGGLVIKGYSAMLVPIVRRAEDSIQWHLLHNTDGSRLTYQDMINRCPNRAFQEEVNHESLTTTRNFLGLWAVSETHLGTSDGNYEDIKWSSAKDVGKSVACSISGVTFGFSHILTIQISVAVGRKDSKLHFSRQGLLGSIISCAERTPVLLYDPGQCDRRAWLVPALDVILHVAHKRFQERRRSNEVGEVPLVSTDPTRNSFAAREALMANLNKDFTEPNFFYKEPYSFKEQFLEVWMFLERMMENLSTSPSLKLSILGTVQHCLQGWEFMALVEGRNFRQKQEPIMKTNGGWLKLVNDIDAIVLFANGFGDIIKPGKGSLPCHDWEELPKGKDYMATSVPMLKRLYREAGSDLALNHLTSTRLQWHRGSTLFESCATGRAPCSCDRLQQIVRKSKFAKTISPPSQLEERGCVAFGQDYHFLGRRYSTESRSNTICIHENLPINVMSSPGIVNLSPKAPYSTRIGCGNHQIHLEALRLGTSLQLSNKNETESEPKHDDTISQPNFAAVIHLPHKATGTLRSDSQLQGDNQKSPSEQWLSLSRYVAIKSS